MSDPTSSGNPAPGTAERPQPSPVSSKAGAVRDVKRGAIAGYAMAATPGQPEMDTDIVVPQGKSVELLVTSNDQVYELVIQGLGASLTAIPGRLQSHTLITKNIGRLVAVCSSACDANGRADAIALCVVSPVVYETWLQTKIDRKP